MISSRRWPACPSIAAAFVCLAAGRRGQARPRHRARRGFKQGSTRAKTTNGPRATTRCRPSRSTAPRSRAPLRALRRRARCKAPPAPQRRPRPTEAAGHRRLLGRRAGLLPFRGRPAAQRGRVGEGGARRGRARVPVGQRGRLRARQLGQLRRRGAVRRQEPGRPSPWAGTRRAPARTACWTWAATSGSGWRTTTTRIPRGGSCGADPAAATSWSRGRQPQRLGACTTATAIWDSGARGEEVTRRHRAASAAGAGRVRR